LQWPAADDGFGALFPKSTCYRGGVAVLSIAIMVISYTNLIVDCGLLQTPPRTIFNAVNDAGAEITPTETRIPDQASPHTTDDSGKIADSVAIRALKRPWINLIENSLSPPRNR
jgi:hypothetical protein